jgi:hypothetical protein
LVAVEVASRHDLPRRIRNRFKRRAADLNAATWAGSTAKPRKTPSGNAANGSETPKRRTAQPSAAFHETATFSALAFAMSDCSFDTATL